MTGRTATLSQQASVLAGTVAARRARMCRDFAGCRWRPLRLICWPPCSFIGASGDARCAHSRPAAGGEARESRRSYTSSGVERTDQALIDAAGKRLLREVLEPLGWVLNETQAGSDYAIDFDVEVFEKQKSTGTIFKVQLKSSASSDYSAAGDFVSQAITVRHARRFVSEIDAPVVLVHADTTNRRIFWFAPQLDGGLPAVFQGKADDAKVVVRILTSNPLPQTVARLRASIAEMQTNLAFRYLSRAAHPEFLAAVERQPDRERLLKDLEFKADLIRLTEADALFKAGKLDEAAEALRSILSDPHASIETRFSALYVAENVDVRRAVNARVPDRDRLMIPLRVALEMRALSRKGPAHLKFVALVNRTAAELAIAANQDWGAALLLQQERQASLGDGVWAMHLASVRAASVRAVARKYNQCMRLARYAAVSKHRWVLPMPLLRIPEGAATLRLRMEMEGRQEVVRELAASAFAICKVAASIAVENRNENELALAAHAALSISLDPQSPERQWAESIFGSLTNETLKRDAFMLLARAVQRRQGMRFEEDIPTTEKQIYENLAAAAGIDVNDSDDLVAQVIRQGLRDLDPTRVLKNCEHILWAPGAAGLPAVWLRMPSAAHKNLHCLKHGHFIRGGLSLDGAYHGFRSLYCDKCPDGTPRAADWSYSPKWLQEQYEKHKDALRRFYAPYPETE